MPKRQHSTKVPVNMQQHYQVITEFTDSFCRDKLNDEYQQLARYTVAALCRKKPSPLTTGRPNTWACAILYALGTINFLFDKSNEPFISAADLAEAFEVSKSNAGNKAKQVRELLNMQRFDHHWLLPSRIDDFSFSWMITLNGFIVDARTLPREIQEIAYEKGIIPYIHADKEQNDA
jgi:hypothetical protein